MKHSLRDGGGFLEIDHRDSPGLTSADVAHVPGAIPVGKGEHFETDVYQCSHCQRTVILRAVPGRMAARGYCQKCHHYICNACEAIRVKTGDCVPFKAVLDHAADIADKFRGQPDHPDAVIDPLQVKSVTSTVTVPDGPRIVLTDRP